MAVEVNANDVEGYWHRLRRDPRRTLKALAVLLVAITASAVWMGFFDEVGRMVARVVTNRESADPAGPPVTPEAGPVPTAPPAEPVRAIRATATDSAKYRQRLCEADSYYRARSVEGRNEALRLYRDVAAKLVAAGVIDPARLERAKQAQRDRHNSTELDEYRAVLNQYAPSCEN